MLQALSQFLAIWHHHISHYYSFASSPSIPCFPPVYKLVSPALRKEAVREHAASKQKGELAYDSGERFIPGSFNSAFYRTFLRDHLFVLRAVPADKL